MMTYAIAYVTTAIVFFSMDFIWLSNMTGGFYRSRIGDLLLDQPGLGVAGLFYLVYVVGVVYFAVLPALNAGSSVTAVISGAILGLVAYGTYDMTNLATVKGWSVSLSIVDMLWGITLTSCAAGCGYFMTKLIVSRI